jgi:prepilin-type N-terminal cleavage/methylation domain-containing protein
MKGYTLIELVVIVVILGILVLIATPKMTVYIENSREAQKTSNARIIYTTALTLEGLTGFPIDSSEAFELNGKTKTLLEHLDNRLSSVKIFKLQNKNTSTWGVTKEDNYIIVTAPDGEIMYENK